MQLKLDMRLPTMMTIGLIGSLMSGLADAQIRNLMPLVDISDTSGLRATSFTCDELENGSLDCRFVFSKVAPKSSDNEIQFREALENQDGESDAFMHFFDQMMPCEELKDIGRNEAERRLTEATDGKLNGGYPAEIAPFILDHCFGSRTPEAIIKLAVAMDELDRRVCELRTQTVSMTLEPSGNNAWALLHGPDPESCGLLGITTLENRDQGGRKWWKFTQQVHLTGNEPECSDIEEQTRVYDESQYREVIGMSCDFITVDWRTVQFGLYLFPFRELGVSWYPLE